MSNDLETLLKILSAIMAMVGFLLTLRRAREDSLRRSEVMVWANQSIAVLKTLSLICAMKRDAQHPDIVSKKVVEVMFDSAILVEKGRLFFKNQIADDHGKDKQAAYRGYRPVILDPLVAAHQIANMLVDADSAACDRLMQIADANVREFVSRIQPEVGRQRTASKVTRQSGQDINIQHHLDPEPAAPGGNSSQP
ncbi:hypothetical protein [Blastomonas sp.]|uniref:hypothetical protein n=1 Tax=Blastomonas sp. TaxID=1909299 RepID=UPI0035930F42